MRSRPSLLLAVSALWCAACSAAEAQTATIRGIHEPARVTPVEPPEPAEPSTPADPDATATTVAPVVVEAKRLTRPEVEKQALRFVQIYATPTAKLEQFARWREPICVTVTASGSFDPVKITERIKEVAGTLGVKVLKPGCAANVEIIFADDPQHWLDWVAAHRETILGFHYVRDTEALKSVTRPIQAWYATATRSEIVANAGLAYAVSGGGRIPGLSSHDETIDDPRGATPAGCGDSRFTSCLQSVFKNVLIFVDRGRLEGQDIGPVSDYLAMLALSQPHSLDGCVSFASVIDLLSSGCRGRSSPDGLTSADRAYLKALYGADLEARRATEEIDIAGRMAAILIKARSRPPVKVGER